MSLGARQQFEDMDQLDDEALVELARDRNGLAIRIIIRRHNQRLFRAARAIMRSDSDAEDVVQAGYVKAFTHLDSFRGDAQLSTWLTRIVLNEALGRLRGKRPTVGIEQIDIESSRGGGQVILFPTNAPPSDPETEMSRMEVRKILERAVDELPAPFRAVFVLRDIEGMSIEETASQLDIKPETVKTRLHRARRLLRGAIEAQMSGAFASLFPFDGAQCVSMADKVLAELGLQD